MKSFTFLVYTACSFGSKPNLHQFAWWSSIKPGLTLVFKTQNLPTKWCVLPWTGSCLQPFIKVRQVSTGDRGAFASPETGEVVPLKPLEKWKIGKVRTRPERENDGHVDFRTNKLSGHVRFKWVQYFQFWLAWIFELNVDSDVDLKVQWPHPTGFVHFSPNRGTKEGLTCSSNTGCRLVVD